MSFSASYSSYMEYTLTNFSICAPIMNKPAPKVKAPQPPTEEAPKAEEAPRAEGEAEVPAETNGDAEMPDSQADVQEPTAEKANMDID